MRDPMASMSLLRSALLNSSRGSGGSGAGDGYFSALLRIGAAEWQQQVLNSRSFASETNEKSDSTLGESVDEQLEKKKDLARWWKAFSEKHRAQEDSANKTSGKEGGSSSWFIPRAQRRLGQNLNDSVGKQAVNNMFSGIKDPLTDQQRRENIGKQGINDVPLGKGKDGASTDQQRQESTSKQVAARWLAAAQQRSSTRNEKSDLSNTPWFASSKDISAATERERLEVSIQRLAMMSKLGDQSTTSNFTFLPAKDALLRKYCQWENLSSPEKHKETLTKVRREFQLHGTDCGSSQVQIAQLTARIQYMTEHMGMHGKDKHSRKGLQAIIQRRRKILKYLRRKDWDGYSNIISKLGLRDNVMETQKH